MNTKVALQGILFYFFLKILFIYSSEIHRERERGRDTGRGRSRLHARESRLEPDAGLDLKTQGSCPGPKAGAKPLSHPGIPCSSFSIVRKKGSLSGSTG